MTILKKHRIIYCAISGLLLISANSCEKNEKPVYSGETVTDIDGNVYNTVKIGDQLWMAENLKVTRYNDGTAVPYLTEKSTWAANRTGGYCWYNNNEAWGALYNWYAVNSGLLAPDGWHVATHNDWTILADFLGGEDVVGGKLKETGGVRWNSPNNSATNDYWFTAIPGGLRSLDGTFSYFGGGAYWWTSTVYDGANAWARNIYWNGTAVGREHIGYVHGLSVRCVKD
jgi:uncharacterized protein (TIGR02145 family)